MQTLADLLNTIPAIDSAAALAACQMSPAIKPSLIPSHLSAEKGARIALFHLGLEPYLKWANLLPVILFCRGKRLLT